MYLQCCFPVPEGASGHISSFQWLKELFEGSLILTGLYTLAKKGEPLSEISM